MTHHRAGAQNLSGAPERNQWERRWTLQSSKNEGKVWNIPGESQKDGGPLRFLGELNMNRGRGGAGKGPELAMSAGIEAWEG
eukprot:361557-Chlamydomonas_euryale.AAC.2